MPIVLTSPKLTNEEDETLLQPLHELVRIAKVAYQSSPRHSLYKAIEQMELALAELEAMV